MCTTYAADLQRRSEDRISRSFACKAHLTGKQPFSFDVKSVFRKESCWRSIVAFESLKTWSTDFDVVSRKPTAYCLKSSVRESECVMSV